MKPISNDLAELQLGAGSRSKLACSRGRSVVVSHFWLSEFSGASQRAVECWYGKGNKLADGKDDF